MSNCYHPELKLAFVHTPKCGGTAISRSLVYDHGFVNVEDGLWYDSSYDQLVKHVSDIEQYQIFTTIRNPVDWVISGYNYCNFYDLTFSEHVAAIIEPWTLINKHNDAEYQSSLLHWYWHCALQPPHHFPYHSVVFKLENISDLEMWLTQKLDNQVKFDNSINKSHTKAPVITESDIHSVHSWCEEYIIKYEYNF
jgi:hypothetical protein